MRRLAALALIVTACGGTPAAETTLPPTTAAVPTTVGETTTTVPGATTTSAVTPTTARVLPEGDTAPGFTVELGEGGTFTLSEHARPVYLLFWAEW